MLSSFKALGLVIDRINADSEVEVLLLDGLKWVITAQKAIKQLASAVRHKAAFHALLAHRASGGGVRPIENL